MSGDGKEGNLTKLINIGNLEKLRGSDAYEIMDSIIISFRNILYLKSLSN